MSPWLGYYGRTQVPSYLSWISIVLAMIFFWPLGLVLLVGRIARDRHAGISTGRVLEIVGVGIFLCSSVTFWTGYSQEIADFGELRSAALWGLAFVAAFGLLGIILWVYGRKLVYRGRMVREYLDVIVNKRFSRIGEIARIVDKPVPLVRSEIGFMILNGFLPDARFGGDGDDILLPSLERYAEVEEEVRSRAAEEEGPRPEERMIVTCRGCGANNVVVRGRPARCEFCGSPLPTK